MRTSLFFLALVLAAPPLSASCAAGEGTTFTSSSGAGAGSSAGPGGGGQGAGTSVSSTGVGFSSGSVGGSVPVGGCTPDLQGYLDNSGNVVPCPPDQGCADGACVPACDAAAKAQGSIGCDFYAADPAFYENGSDTSYDGSCYAVFIANTWGRPAQITVSRGGQSFNLAQFGRIPSGIVPNIVYNPIPATGVPPNEVAVLFLAHEPDAQHQLGTPLTCPVTPALLSDAAVKNSGPGLAFHVVSDTPVTAYDILPYGGAKSYLPSASLLYPSTAWGKNYYVITPHQEGGGSLWLTIVGATNGTTVTLFPPTNLPGGGPLPGAPALTPTDFNVNAGDMLQWIGADPTGTIVDSTQPVGVFTGSTYLRVASQTSPSGGGQDSSHQQLPHINALGSEYVGPNIVTRLASLAPESVIYRVLGVVDGTTLTYDPGAPLGAPVKLDAGQYAQFETTTIFSVKSQDDDHPFEVTQYMPGAPTGNSREGCGADPPFPGLTMCALGDEEWVTLLPPKQFLGRYVFFTDPTFSTTNLVVTRVKGENGFSDVTIDCMGAPISSWMPVGSGGLFEVAHVDLVRGGQPVAQCNGSRHEAKSEGTFGVMVWGTDWYASYGYPAGGYVRSINSVYVPPILQ
jgi:hypothetical protein